METQIIHHAKIYIIFKKNPLKEPKTLQHIITLLQLIPSFNTSQISSFKNPHIKINRPIIIIIT
jgi:hypothetical protein